MLASDFTPSIPTHLFLPSSPSIFVILTTPSQNAAGGEPRAGSDAASGAGGAATTPGTVLGSGGCHPRGRPGLSRAPARTPPISEEPLGGVGGESSAKRRRGSKDRSLLRWPKLMRDEKGGGRWSSYGAGLRVTPFVVPGEVDWQGCSEIAEVGAQVPPGASRGL